MGKWLAVRTEASIATGNDCCKLKASSRLARDDALIPALAAAGAFLYAIFLTFALGSASYASAASKYCARDREERINGQLSMSPAATSSSSRQMSMNAPKL